MRPKTGSIIIQRVIVGRGIWNHMHIKPAVDVRKSYLSTTVVQLLLALCVNLQGQGSGQSGSAGQPQQNNTGSANNTAPNNTGNANNTVPNNTGNANNTAPNNTGNTNNTTGNNSNNNSTADVNVTTTERPTRKPWPSEQLAYIIH
ncbi:hypothetical protein ANCCEY_05881 [Ancylostoma ceylanicum]|uniref:Uncharacterized protein n=1 Tax=Ancylostoma ceylanicum TaxID=53326 RepID=A0A0D6M542_9BILA|nr:hypothetical protein ANCCEY_05881 [Ancylostoma ceylanicum]